jgi:cytochrome c peroxidase
MKQKLGLIFAVLLMLTACGRKDEKLEIRFYKPANFPEPVYDFSKNPVTSAGFRLGKELFYDGRLSRDGSINCGSCHEQSAAFTQHGHDLSHGIDDRLTLRNALPIMNLAWEKNFFWDGGVFHLDLFAVSPIENPDEMDESLSNVLEKLRKDAKYRRLFKEAFGSEDITTERFLKALSQFQLMCISANSRYDKYVRGEGVQLSGEEKAGLDVFKQKCASCHAGELFTDLSFRNNGLKVFNADDTGRGRITLNPEDKYKFKVPSLRNVEASAPHMHDGRFRTLDEVLEHYASGIQPSETLDPLLRNGIPLSAAEREQLKAFLLTLKDDEFLRNPLLSEF